MAIGIVWNGKVRENAMRCFTQLAVTESTCGCLLGLYLCFIEWNVWVFAIASLVYSNIVSIFVGKCIMAFKATLWPSGERETYDNNMSIVQGIVCIAGYVMALISLPPLKLSLLIWSLCCVIDDAGWLTIYMRNRKLLMNEKQRI